MPFVHLTRLAFTELVRQPVCLLITLASVALSTALPLMIAHQLGQQGGLARDGALAFELTGGTILAAYAACSTLSREMRSGTILTILSRPIGRSTLFLVGRSTGTLQGMVGVGPGTFIDELMQIAGASNALAGAPMQYPNVSLEQILTRDPEVILDMGDFAHAEGRPGQPEAQILALWAAYPRLRAVHGHGVQVISSDVLVRPGPRMAEAARALLALVHPEAVQTELRPKAGAGNRP